MGVALFGQGKFKEAAHEFEVGLELEPDSGRLAYNLGRSLESAGELPRSAAAYRRYLELSPDAGDRTEIETVLKTLYRKIEEAEAKAEPTPAAPDLTPEPDPAPAAAAVAAPAPAPKPAAEPSTAAVTATPPPPPAPPRGSDSSLTTVLLVGAGAAAAISIVGLVQAMDADSRTADFEAKFNATSEGDPAHTAALSSYDQANSDYKTWSTVSIVTGGVAAALLTVLGARLASTSTAVTVVPGGAAVVGSWP